MLPERVRASIQKKASLLVEFQALELNESLYVVCVCVCYGAGCTYVIVGVCVSYGVGVCYSVGCGV